MLYENIGRIRRERGMSQEELAVRLNVVRQTVSKWENGRSVPDAQMLMDMAHVLDVPVSCLLGQTSEDVPEELARLNEIIARKNRRELLMEEAGKKRGMILLLSFAALLCGLAVDNAMLSLVLTGLCLMAALVILYRNLALLTSVTTQDLKLGMLRIVTVINGIMLLALITFSVLVGVGVITMTEHGEQALAMGLVACVMVFSGIVSPRLPFNRHIGLRLPWTVTDEETWNVAHRVLGIIAVPVALLYIVCAWTVHDLETVTLVAVMLWVGIPGVVSWLFYRRKMLR